jgi:hypothetical protein
MEHAALARVHGLKAEGLTGVFDFVDGGVGGILESAGAGSLVAVGIEGNAIVIFGLEAKDLGGDVLEGAEELAVAREQEIAVRSLALDVDVAAFKAVGVNGASASRNAVFEAELTRGGQQPHEGGHLFSS